MHYSTVQADHTLGILEAMEDDPVFGYSMNRYRHHLQSATKVLRGGFDKQTVVTALIHNVGFNVTPQTHGEFAAKIPEYRILA